MSATVSIKQAVGSGPTTTTISNLRFNTDDTVNPGTTNPMVKPSSGYNYSYRKTLFLNADTTPSTKINNVRVYSDGAIGWSGCTLFIGTTGTYSQATGTQGVSGNQDTSIATANIQKYTSGSPKQVTGSISNPNTGRITDYIYLQTQVSSTVTPGTLEAENLTFAYDEV